MKRRGTEHKSWHWRWVFWRYMRLAAHHSEQMASGGLSMCMEAAAFADQYMRLMSLRGQI
jgi:hypothetical protein